MNAAYDHIVHNDFPETPSRLEAEARAAGLDDMTELARFGPHALFCFGASARAAA